MESILLGTNWMWMHVVSAVYPAMKSFRLLFHTASSARVVIEEAKLAADSIDLINSVVHKCIQVSDERARGERARGESRSVKEKTKEICEETLDIIILKTIESLSR